MKATALKNKLSKLGIEFTTKSNGYNVDINFTINKIDFIADHTEDSENIISLIRIINYDKQIQEMQIRSFDNLAQLIKYANRK